MFSFSLDDIVELFQGTSLIYSLVLVVIGVVLGFVLAKAWFNRTEKNLKDKEERLNDKEDYFKSIQSENDSLKSELEKIKSNPDYWIKNRADKSLVSERSDVHKI